QQKLISQEQLKAALEDQGRSGRKLGRVLIENGYLSEDQIGEALARQLGVPFINLKYYNFNSAVPRKLHEAQTLRFRPLLLDEQGLHIRFRIDGLLQPQTETDTKISSAVAQRLKLMSGLDISERRLPQDGRFNVKVRDKQVDVRISSMPTQHGEAIVMRLLHRAGGLHQLSDLGMSPDVLQRFTSAIHRYTGMVLVTGPTGSGKTTTLYGALNELNTPDCKIITVEDPVEYRLDGVNQVQVNEKIELTFSRVLRSALRQDPDVILIGEMRDVETAQIGLRAAITGHMVLSTLHTRDAASAPLRLVDMGVPRYMV